MYSHKVLVHVMENKGILRRGRDRGKIREKKNSIRILAAYRIMTVRVIAQ